MRFIGGVTRILSDPSTSVLLELMDRICGVHPTPGGETTGVCRGGAGASVSCFSVSATFCDALLFLRIPNIFQTAMPS